MSGIIPLSRRPMYISPSLWSLWRSSCSQTSLRKYFCFPVRRAGVIWKHGWKASGILFSVLLMDMMFGINTANRTVHFLKSTHSLETMLGLTNFFGQRHKKILYGNTTKLQITTDFSVGTDFFKTWKITILILFIFKLTSDWVRIAKLDVSWEKGKRGYCSI